MRFSRRQNRNVARQRPSRRNFHSIVETCESRVLLSGTPLVTVYLSDGNPADTQSFGPSAGMVSLPNPPVAVGTFSAAFATGIVLSSTPTNFGLSLGQFAFSAGSGGSLTFDLVATGVTLNNLPGIASFSEAFTGSVQGGAGQSVQEQLFVSPTGTSPSDFTSPGVGSHSPNKQLHVHGHIDRFINHQHGPGR